MQKLTNDLANSIVAAAQATMEFNGVTAATGVSSELLKDWIQRGARQKTGSYRALLERLKPYLGEMYRRQVRAGTGQFFANLAAIAEADNRAERILTVWYNSISLNDPRVPEEIRLELARKITAAIGRPIHPARWRVVKDELKRRSGEKHRSQQTELGELMLTTAFIAAGRLDAEQLADPPSALEQIRDAHSNMRRLINTLLTEDLAGPGWRHPETELAVDGAVDSSIKELLQRKRRAKTMMTLREFVIQRLAQISKKAPRDIEKIFDHGKIQDVKALSDKLKVERTKLIREVVIPARTKEKLSS
jgi:hypothetical protein